LASNGAVGDRAVVWHGVGTAGQAWASSAADQAHGWPATGGVFTGSRDR